MEGDMDVCSRITILLWKAKVNNVDMLFCGASLYKNVVRFQVLMNKATGMDVFDRG